MRPLLDNYGNRNDKGRVSDHSFSIDKIEALIPKAARPEALRSESAGFAVLDAQLRYLYLNDALAVINGLSAEVHIGRTVYDISPKIAPQLESAVEQILSTGEPVPFLEIRDPGGNGSSARRFISCFIPIRDEHGHPSKVGLLMIDSSNSTHETGPASAKLSSYSDEVRGFLGKQDDEDADILNGLSKALAKAADVLKKQRIERRVEMLDFSRGIDFYEEVSRFEKDLITQALKHTGGNQTKAAELLGIKVSTIHAMIKRYDIGPSSESGS